MIPELLRPQLDRHSRSLLRELLSIGPWGWPVQGDALDRALSVVPCGPPAARPGQTLLVTVSPTTTSLWVLSASEGPTPQQGQHAGLRPLSVPMGRSARRAWSLAAAALPRSVPLLWASVEQVERRHLEARWLSSITEQGAIEARETVIDGSSFGLSFLLAIASLVFDRPLPVDLAASAEIDALGAVQPVGGIDRKVQMIAARVPRVRRILVAASQSEQAAQSCGGNLTVIGVRTAADALQEAFGHELSAMLTLAGSDTEKRSELVQSFFRLALSGRAAMVDWTPVAQAATVALESWTELGLHQRESLAFVRGVAARHEGNAVGGELPGREWLCQMPAPVRLDVLSHVVQQSADTAQPEPREVIELAQAHLVRGQDAFTPHLRLLGALGRLLSAVGKWSEGLALQREAARGFCSRLSPSDLSYPLSEWYRLAGVLRDEQAFREADLMRQQAAQMQAPDLIDNPYVDLAMCRARVMLGKDLDAALSRLQSLCLDPSLPSHVRWSAVRWLVRAIGVQPDASQAERWIESLRAAANGSARDARLASRYSDLIDLDRAVRDSDSERSSTVVLRMQAADPGLFKNLLLGAPNGLRRPAHLANVYPY